MVRFAGMTRLPPRWVYVPSPRQIRGLLEELRLGRDVPGFSGTGSGPGPTGLTLGFLTRRVREGEWEFWVSLWGVPEDAVEGRKDALADAALGTIRDRIAECASRPPLEIEQPTQVWLRFAFSPEGVVSKYTVRELDMFWSRRWWAFRTED